MNSQAKKIFEEASLLDPKNGEAKLGQAQALTKEGDGLMDRGLFSDALKSL